MTCATYDFKPIARGSTRSTTFRYKNEDGSARSLVDVSFRLVATWRGGSITKTIGNGITVATPSNGEALIRFTTDDSNAMPLGRLTRYFWERTQGADIETDFDGYITIEG